MADLSYIATIADLKALSDTSSAALATVYVEGYDADADGGEGVFWWDGASTAAENGGTVIVPDSAPASGRWRRSTGDKPLTPEMFGAIGSGSNPLSTRFASLAAAQAVYPHATALTDEIDWAAIQAAIDTAKDGGAAGMDRRIELASADYRINRALRVYPQTALIGQGIFRTAIRYTSATGNAIEPAEGRTTHVHIHGIYLYSSVAMPTLQTVTGAADNGSGLIRLTVTGHGFVGGEVVNVQGVRGTTEANDLWRIIYVDADNFDLSGSAFVNGYESGGKCYGTRFKYITNATSSTGGEDGVIRLTIPSHGYTTDDWVHVTGVRTNVTEANGSWQATVIDADTIELQGSRHGGGAYVTADRGYASNGSVGVFMPSCNHWDFFNFQAKNFQVAGGLLVGRRNPKTGAIDATGAFRADSTYSNFRHCIFQNSGVAGLWLTGNGDIPGDQGSYQGTSNLQRFDAVQFPNAYGHGLWIERGAINSGSSLAFDACMGDGCRIEYYGNNLQGIVETNGGYGIHILGTWGYQNDVWIHNGGANALGEWHDANGRSNITPVNASAGKGGWRPGHILPVAASNDALFRQAGKEQLNYKTGDHIRRLVGQQAINGRTSLSAGGYQNIAVFQVPKDGAVMVYGAGCTTELGGVGPTLTIELHDLTAGVMRYSRSGAMAWGDPLYDSGLLEGDTNFAVRFNNSGDTASSIAGVMLVDIVEVKQ